MSSYESFGTSTVKKTKLIIIKIKSCSDDTKLIDRGGFEFNFKLGVTPSSFSTPEFYYSYESGGRYTKGHGEVLRRLSGVDVLLGMVYTWKLEPESEVLTFFI